jgi:hypothetical protein
MTNTYQLTEEHYRKVSAEGNRPTTCSQFSEHITDLGIITMHLYEDGEWVWVKDKKSHEKLNPKWFMELLPPPVKAEERFNTVIKKGKDIRHGELFWSDDQQKFLEWKMIDGDEVDINLYIVKSPEIRKPTMPVESIGYKKPIKMITIPPSEVRANRPMYMNREDAIKEVERQIRKYCADIRIDRPIEDQYYILSKAAEESIDALIQSGHLTNHLKEGKQR